MIEYQIMEFLNGLKKKDFNSAFNILKQKMKKRINNDSKYFENKYIF